MWSSLLKVKMAVFGTPVSRVRGCEVGDERMREVTSVENVSHFLLSLFFVKDEEFISVRDVNSVRSVAHGCVCRRGSTVVVREVASGTHATME